MLDQKIAQLFPREDVEAVISITFNLDEGNDEAAHRAGLLLSETRYSPVCPVSLLLRPVATLFLIQDRESRDRIACGKLNRKIVGGKFSMRQLRRLLIMKSFSPRPLIKEQKNWAPS